MEPNEVYAGTSVNLQSKKLIKRRQVVQEWASTEGANSDAPHRIIEMENEEEEEDDNS